MKQKNRSQAFFDVATAADKWAVACPRGAEILELNCAILGTDAGGCTIKFDSLQGSTRGDGDIGILTIPASNLIVQTIQEIPANGLVRVAAGGAVIIQVTAEGVDSLLVCVEVVWRDLGESDANTTAVTAG